MRETALRKEPGDEESTLRSLARLGERTRPLNLTCRTVRAKLLLAEFLDSFALASVKMLLDFS
jgi:hypothetical protein